jgi:hypothetical protein
MSYDPTILLILRNSPKVSVSKDEARDLGLMVRDARSALLTMRIEAASDLS